MVNAYAALPVFLLVLARVAGLMLASPLFAGSMIPLQINVILAVTMSLAVFPLMITQVAVPVTLGSALAGLAGELALGLVLGMGVTLIFIGVQMAAQVASQQAGLALGEVFNPLLESTTTELSQLYFIVSMGVFLAVDGHHALIRALMDSFSTIPLLGFKPEAGLIDLLISILTASFIIALRVSGPVMLALMLGFLTLGFISRTVPQFNLLTIGFPVKLAMALFLMAMTMITLEPILIDGMNDVMDDLRAGLGISTTRSADSESELAAPAAVCLRFEQAAGRECQTGIATMRATGSSELRRSGNHRKAHDSPWLTCVRNPADAGDTFIYRKSDHAPAVQA